MCADATQNTRTRALLGANPHGSRATGLRKEENLEKTIGFDGFRGDPGLMGAASGGGNELFSEPS